MRSITLKLVLAFIGVSFLSVAIIVLVIRWSTNKEFYKFVLDTNQANLVSTLAYYYEENQGWSGLQIDQLISDGRQPFRLGNHQQQHFAIADANGMVVAGNGGYHTGQMLAQSDLKSGIPIQVNNANVGTLLLQNFNFNANPREAQFLQTMNGLLWISGIGTVIIALILGVWLSRTLTRPVRELTAATHAVSLGKLGVKVPVRSRDELGDLALAFNRMNSELERSLTLRKQMTADIAHELRTPLSLILGHAEAVHDGVLPPSIKSYEVIREEALRLEHLIDDLRVLSLADAGELSLTVQPASIQNWLEEIRARYEQQARSKNIQLDLRIEADLPEIDIDRARMTQVLTNILDNALRYTPEGGVISLAASREKDFLKLSIQDSGPGIAREDLERIFDRFYRTDPSRQRLDGGSGLGLAIAKSLVERHHGTIKAESLTGSGLRIEILLPTRPAS